jgi:nicotinate-nucleotide pyrophosphorylase (carboxylating)
MVKDTGIIAGIESAKEVFSFIDLSIIFNPLCKDGDEVNYGDIAF